MSEKPIIFKEWKARVIQQWDWKQGPMQTRRLLKPQPIVQVRNCKYDPDTNGLWVSEGNGEWLGWKCKIPYQQGDILWVKETHALVEIICNVREKRWLYKADNPNKKVERWYSPRFMPKEMARLWLEVLDVKVERLQEILLEDIGKEGVFLAAVHIKKGFTPLDLFVLLWDDIYKTQPQNQWAANPWVAVVEFVKKEV